MTSGVAGGNGRRWGSRIGVWGRGGAGREVSGSGPYVIMESTVPTAQLTPVVFPESPTAHLLSF